MNEPTTALVTVLGLLAAGAWLSRAARCPEATAWLLLGLLGTAGLTALDIDIEPWLAMLKSHALDLVLPVLVFQSAYSIDARNRRHLPAAALLAIGAFVLTLVGAGLVYHWFLVDRWHVSWMIGIAATLVLLPTDATAGAPLLRLNSPRGLRMLLRNELPFAAALCAAGIGVIVALPDSVDAANVVDLVVGLVPALVIGVAVGAAVGWLGAQPLRFIAGGAVVHWLSLLAAVLAHRIAEMMGGAGITAVLAAALVLGRQPAAPIAENLWRPLGRAASGMLVLALGALLYSYDLTAYAPLAIAMLSCMLVLRTVSVWAVESATHRRTKMGISRRELALISVLSTRGAPTIALALALPDSLPYVDTIRSVAIVVVAFDLLVTAPASGWLAKRFANHAPLPPITRKKIEIPY